MISAKDARNKTGNRNNEVVQRQLESIESIINSAIREGKFQAYYYKNIYPATENILEELGYNISSYSYRNETTVTISW